MRETLNRLALACSDYLRANYPARTNCIEAAFLFQSVALRHSLLVHSAVGCVRAYNPLAVSLHDAGRSPDEIETVSGAYMLEIGRPQRPNDYPGRFVPERNEFIGHVWNLISDSGQGSYLVDVSALQMHRPNRGIHIDAPIVVGIDERDIGHYEIRHPDGYAITYDLYGMVRPPIPVTSAKLMAAAELIADDFCIADNSGS